MTKHDNKFYGRTLLLVLFIVYLINASFPYYAASVINAFMAKDLGLDRKSLGLGFTVFALSFGVFSSLAGFCVTKIGARLTLLVGEVILIIGSLLMAFVASQAWQYILFYGIILGFGTAMGGPMPAQATVTYWFKRRKALAMSIVLSATGVGALIAAPMLNNIIASTDGNWRIGWLVVTAFFVISAIITIFCVKNTPADIGQFPDGIPPEENAVDSLDTDPVKKMVVYQCNESWTLRNALKTKSLWMIVFACVAFMAAINICVAHGMIHLIDLGHPKSISALSVGILGMSTLIGKLFAGALGDRVEPRIIWAGALYLIIAGMMILTNATNAWLMYLYAILVGTGVGAAYVCKATIVGNYFGVKAFAPVMGVVFPISSILAAASPFLAGIIYDYEGAYTSAFYGVSILAIISSILIFLAKPPRDTRDFPII